MKFYLKNISVGEVYERHNPVTEQDYEEALRLLRFILLTDSDWTQVADNSLSEDEREEWKIWRELVRQLPDAATRPLGETIEVADAPLRGRAKQWDNLQRDIDELMVLAQQYAREQEEKFAHEHHEVVNPPIPTVKPDIEVTQEQV